MANESGSKARRLKNDLYDKKFTSDDRKQLKISIEGEFSYHKGGIVYDILDKGIIPTLEQESAIYQDLINIINDSKLFCEKWNNFMGRGIKKKAEPVSKSVEKLNEFLNRPRKLLYKKKQKISK